MACEGSVHVAFLLLIESVLPEALVRVAVSILQSPPTPESVDLLRAAIWY